MTRKLTILPVLVLLLLFTTACDNNAKQLAKISRGIGVNTGDLVEMMDDLTQAGKLTTDERMPYLDMAERIIIVNEQINQLVGPVLEYGLEGPLKIRLLKLVREIADAINTGLQQGALDGIGNSSAKDEIRTVLLLLQQGVEGAIIILEMTDSGGSDTAMIWMFCCFPLLGLALDPVTLGILLRTGLKLTANIISIIRNDDGSVTIIEYSDATSKINEEVLDNIRRLKEEQDGPTPGG